MSAVTQSPSFWSGRIRAAHLTTTENWPLSYKIAAQNRQRYAFQQRAKLMGIYAALTKEDLPQCN